MNGNGGTPGVRAYTYGDLECRDFVFSTDVRKVQGDRPGFFTSYGIQVRSDGAWNDLYEFFMHRGGGYLIAKYVNGGYQNLVPWSSTGAISNGFGTNNNLKVVANANTLGFYVNGVQVGHRKVPGDFSNWDDGYRLGLGNEFTGDRPWQGEWHLVAIYNRALDPAEVKQNYNAGASATG